MQCKELESVLKDIELASLPDQAREHLSQCVSCRTFVADLETIVSVAEQLPAEIEPPARIWVSLRAQLEQEGIIKEPAAKLKPVSWWHGFADLFRGRALATATVGLVILAATVFQLIPSRNISEDTPSTPQISAINDSLSDTARTLNEQENDLTNMHFASTSPVDVSLQQNLRSLDEFIADCERHLKEAPRDALAREYLASAYQQKAELLSAMLDRGRSIN